MQLSIAMLMKSKVLGFGLDYCPNFFSVSVLPFETASLQSQFLVSAPLRLENYAIRDMI